MKNPPAITFTLRAPQIASDQGQWIARAMFTSESGQQHGLECPCGLEFPADYGAEAFALIMRRIGPNWFKPGPPRKSVPKTIQVGQVLTARSPADADCVFTEFVLTRDKSFATVTSMGREVRVKIHTDQDGNEFVYAHGRHSMCPIFRAP